MISAKTFLRQAGDLGNRSGKGRPVLHCLGFILAAYLLLALSGCAAHDYRSHHGGRSGRGSLSRVIDPGSVGEGRNRHRPHERSDFPDVPRHAKQQMNLLLGGLSVLNEISTANEAAAPPPQLAAFEPPPSYHDPGLGISVSSYRSMTAGKQFESYYRHSLQVFAPLEHSTFALGLAVTDYDFDDDWRYAAKLKHPWSVDFGLDYRFYPLARKRFFRPYFGAGFAYGKFSWSYEEPIIDASTGEEFNDDSLDYVNVAALIGFDFNFSSYAKLGIELRQDFTFYSITTNEGFTDDIFDDYGSTSLGLRYSVVF